MEGVVDQPQWKMYFSSCNGRISSLAAMEEVVELLLWKE
jgi:hypothetical protein